MDNTILKALRHGAREGERLLLATLVETRGTTSRDPGTRMLIRTDGTTEGTVGGGTSEKEVYLRALQLLEEGEDTPEILRDISTCGGALDVLLEPRPDTDFWHLVEEVQLSGREAVLLTSLTEPSEKALYSGEGALLGGVSVPEEVLQGEDTAELSHPGTVRVLDALGDRWLAEALEGVPRLLILGAGHVARWLVYGAAPLEFHVTVIDNREEFARTERLPEADQVLFRDFREGIREVRPDRNTYVVLASWSHGTDAQCLEEVLRHEVAYMGMLGSRKKVEALSGKMLELGFSREQLEKLHSPIGLDIGAQSPQEIAIGVLAEIIAVRRGKQG